MMTLSVNLSIYTDYCILHGKFTLFCTACIVGTGVLLNSCYILFAQPNQWIDAENHCQRLDGHLVKITSSDETEFVKSTFLTSHGLVYWIGLSDQATEDTWKWTDGSTLSGYTNWKSSQPSNNYGNQNCAAIVMTVGRFQLGAPSRYTLNNHNAEWNDLECHFSFGYICEQMKEP